MNTPITIIGGGAIGLAIGWQLARQGNKAALYERDLAGKGTSWVSAGMLAPHAEVGFEEPEFFKFGLESLRRYPRFLEELREDSGEHVELYKAGCFAVALSRDDEEFLDRAFDFQLSLGFAVKRLTSKEARSKEPLLSPQTVSAIFISDDLHLDPRKLLPALRIAFVKAGGELHEHSAVNEIVIENGAVRGIKVNDERIASETVLLAAGSWSPKVKGIPDDLLPPVRPVKGQILSLRGNRNTFPSYVIRTPHVYIAPKEDRLIVGGTVEEMSYDLTPTAGAVWKLLEEAFKVVPAISGCELGEIGVGLRPGTLDNLPIIGQTSIRGLHYATGHYRDGILLTPITAYEMCNLLMHRNSAILSPYSPMRFQSGKSDIKLRQAV